MPEPINPANPYSPTVDDVAAMENLTGESLILYLSARLNSLDDEIQGMMGEQQRMLARKEFLSRVKVWANEVADANEAVAHGSGDPAKVNELLENFPEGPPGDHDFVGEIHRVYAEICPLNKDGNKDNIERFTNRLDEMMNELNGASELGMIRLQQLISQRQLAVQLCTNMLSKCDEGLKGIVQNL